MRGEHAGKEDGFRPRKAQEPACAEGAEDLRHQEGEGAEDETRLSEAMEIVEIDFEAGEEHQVKQAHFAEELEDLVDVEPAKAMFADEDAGEDDSGDIRKAQANGDERGDEQKRHDEREVEDQSVGIHGATIIDGRGEVKRRKRGAERRDVQFSTPAGGGSIFGK